MRIATNALTIGRIAAATWSFLRQRAAELATEKLLPIQYRLLHTALGKGYGYPTDAAIGAMPQVQASIDAAADQRGSAWPRVALVGTLVVLLIGAGAFWLVRDDKAVEVASTTIDALSSAPSAVVCTVRSANSGSTAAEPIAS